MSFNISEWLNLIFRWVHVFVSIMWIGQTFLFTWMDRALNAEESLWMVHSGGFYEVVKRRYLAPAEVPASLHWFMWEAYTTWISGFFLLGVVYFVGGGVFLVDPGVRHLPLAGAIGLSLSVLVLGWLVYDTLWRSPLGTRPTLAASISFALIAAAAIGLTRVYSGRAAFLLLGAMLGTIMAANVWRRIIPAQRQMLAATRAGGTVDVSLGVRAKQRSIHNHYLTLPVLFTMLSNHFPSAYGHPLSWLVLVLLVIVGAAVKHVMSFRARSSRWAVLAGAGALAAGVALTVRVPVPGATATGLASGDPVSFETAHAIIGRRCLSCHAAHPSNPSFPQPPAGIVLEDPARIRSLAPRILVRAVVTKTMPLGNLTGMTDGERDSLRAWIAQGARIDLTAGTPDRP